MTTPWSPLWNPGAYAPPASMSIAASPTTSILAARLSNTFPLPHIGSATVETRSGMGLQALDNLDAFFAGKPPPNRLACINGNWVRWSLALC